jgi:hypothetical protein
MPLDATERAAAACFETSWFRRWQATAGLFSTCFLSVALIRGIAVNEPCSPLVRPLAFWGT